MERTGDKSKYLARIDNRLCYIGNTTIYAFAKASDTNAAVVAFLPDTIWRVYR